MGHPSESGDKTVNVVLCATKSQTSKGKKTPEFAALARNAAHPHEKREMIPVFSHERTAAKRTDSQGARAASCLHILAERSTSWLHNSSQRPPSAVLLGSEALLRALWSSLRKVSPSGTYQTLALRCVIRTTSASSISGVTWSVSQTRSAIARLSFLACSSTPSD